LYRSEANLSRQGVLNRDVFYGKGIDDVHTIDDPVGATTAPVSVRRVMVDLASAIYTQEGANRKKRAAKKEQQKEKASALTHRFRHFSPSAWL
jgi:hypothetical protein